ncbi:MAG: hypothetical protein R3Y61_07125 [Rikenellaceae bacterium]
MNFKTYIRRMAKYAIYLVIVLMILLTIMNLLQATEEGQTSLLDMLLSQRGLYMLCVIIAFSAIYPFMGYTKKTLVCNAEKRSEEFINVMSMCGYTVTERSDNKMTFRASNFAKKLILMFEDTITVETTASGLSIMRGPRREVVKAAFRSGTFVQ